MNRIHGLPLLVGLAVAVTLLAGCHLPAAPAVTPTPSEAEIQAGMEQMGTVAAATATQTAMPQSPLPTETPQLTPQPTSIPTGPPPTSPTAPATTAPTQPPALQPTSTPTAVPSGTETTYVVQRGDNLFRIAQRFGLRYQELAAYNGIVNPHRIYVGQIIRIPAGSTPAPQPSGGEILYTVKAGENLFRIGLRYNVNYLYLAHYNGIANPHRIYAGQVLRIPAAQ